MVENILLSNKYPIFRFEMNIPRNIYIYKQHQMSVTCIILTKQASTIHNKTSTIVGCLRMEIVTQNNAPWPKEKNVQPRRFQVTQSTHYFYTKYEAHRWPPKFTSYAANEDITLLISITMLCGTNNIPHEYFPHPVLI